MSTQKAAVLTLGENQRTPGRPVGEVLTTLGIGRATYYRWQHKQGRTQSRPRTTYPLTPDEKRQIEAVQEAHPGLRHRQLQGVLQIQGVYLSSSSIDKHVKALDRSEPYHRRPAPWACCCRWF